MRAASWIAENLPVFALNIILITDSELWALRYPDVHELYVLERAAGGPSGHRASGARERTRLGARPLRRPGHAPAVIVASERMDEDAGWRPLESGELLHVDPDLNVTVTRPLTEPPAHQLTLADLGEKAAASQAAAQQHG